MFLEHQFVEARPAAVAAVLQRWQAQHPGMAVLALLPEAEDDAVAGLQAACSAQGVRLWGAVFPALLGPQGFVQSGALLIGLDGGTPAFLLDDLQREGSLRLRDAVQAAQAGAPGAAAPGGGTLFTIFDAMLPHIGSLLTDVHGLLGDCAPRYLGVNAGSERFQPMACLFDNTRRVHDGVLGIYSAQPLPSAVHHAYEKSRSQWRATSAAGNRIVQIDEQPAFAAYQRIVEAEYAVQLTPANFYDYAVHFPFGLVTAVDVLVRIPVALGEDASIVCVGEIAPNSLLRLLSAPALAGSACAQELGERLRAQGVSGAQPLLGFYCAGRRMHFGAQATEELAQIRAALDGAPLYGALSLGEIDTLDDMGYPRFHNAAVVCAAA